MTGVNADIRAEEAREAWRLAKSVLRLHRLLKLDAPTVILEREKRIAQRRAWALPVYCPDFEELTKETTLLNPLYKSCEWTPIEKDADIYNVGCQEREEYHLTEGCELYKYCQWCGGEIYVVDLEADDDAV